MGRSGDGKRNILWGWPKDFQTFVTKQSNGNTQIFSVEIRRIDYNRSLVLIQNHFIMQA